MTRPISDVGHVCSAPLQSRLVLSGVLAVVLAAAWATGAFAEERFPPPDFTSHQLPVTTTPPARALVWEYLDVAALVVGLSLASYFGLVSRWRRGLFLLAIVALAWLGFWRRGCVCPIGATQDVTQALFDPAYVVPYSVVAMFAVPLVFTLFFGRTFCAAVCPLGAVQELVAVRPQKVPAWLEHALGLLPFVYLGLAVVLAATGTAYVICQYDPFVSFFRLGGSVNMLVVGGCFLVIGLLVGRPYCRFLCPYGALLGLASKVSRWHVRIPPQECSQCRLCEDVCPYGAIQAPTVEQTPAQRAAGRRRLAAVLLLAPVLVAAGAGLGCLLGDPLAWMDRDVRLAKWVRQSQLDPANQQAIDAVSAFRNTGRPVSELLARADQRRRLFFYAGAGFGAWVGLVIGVKLVHLCTRRRRIDYQPDPARCVSCGRCFWYCPHEQVRLGLIPAIGVLVKRT